MGGPLNLQDADLKGFDAVDPQRINAVVHEIKMDAVKNTRGTGKMAAGTPMIKVQWRATEDNVEGLENRRFFSQHIIPPENYDDKKAAQRMKGMVARLFIALGETEETVLGKKFAPDLEDYVGKPAVIQVGKEQKRTNEGDPIEGEFNNPVKSVRPPGTNTGSDSSSLL